MAIPNFLVLSYSYCPQQESLSTVMYFFFLLICALGLTIAICVPIGLQLCLGNGENICKSQRKKISVLAPKSSGTDRSVKRFRVHRLLIVLQLTIICGGPIEGNLEIMTALMSCQQNSISQHFSLFKSSFFLPLLHSPNRHYFISDLKPTHHLCSSAHKHNTVTEHLEDFLINYIIDYKISIYYLCDF